MSQRVALSGSVSTSPSGSSGASGEIVLDSQEETFEDVRQREAFRLTTAGNPGAAFVEVDIPPTALQIVLVSRDQATIWARLNGAPATVTSGAGAPGTVAGAEGFSLQVDVGSVIPVTLEAGDTTFAKIAARINAAMGAIVATVVAGVLQLEGVLSGGETASDEGRQFGRITLSADVSGGLAKCGLVAGTTYGKGIDIPVRRRLVLEGHTSGNGAIDRLELSGSGDMTTHVAGN